jgi:hypothetical protein
MLPLLAGKLPVLTHAAPSQGAAFAHMIPSIASVRTAGSVAGKPRSGGYYGSYVHEARQDAGYELKKRTAGEDGENGGPTMILHYDLPLSFAEGRLAELRLIRLLRSSSVDEVPIREILRSSA